MNKQRRQVVQTLDTTYGLTLQEINFVTEYCKDFSPRRAATASGYSPEAGYRLVKKDNIVAAVQYILAGRMEESAIDAEWLLYELVDNHMMARQQGNLAASTTALGHIAKHKMVDANAADKVDVVAPVTVVVDGAIKDV